MPDLLEAVLVLAGTAVFACCLAGLGRLSRGAGGLAVADLAAGWGLYLILLMLGQRAGLGLAAAGLPALGLGLLVFLWDRWRAGLPAPRAAVWLMQLPLLLLAALMPVVAWDDFSHWLPNARFLLAHDSFPGPGLPPPASVHGVYPPAVAVVTHGVTLIARPLGLGGLPEQAAQIFTLLLYGALAAGVAEVAARRGLTAAAAAVLALLCVVWANPGFVPRIVFTNYGDAPTAALLGTALLVFLRATEAPDPRRFLLQGALILAAVVGVKQTGIVLAAIGLAGAGGLWLALRRPLLPGLGALLLAALPALLVWWLWRRHAAAAAGGFSIAPLSDWAWTMAPETLRSMGRVVISKAPFMLVLLGAVTMALRALRRAPEAMSARAAILAAAMGLLWPLALFLAYVGTSFAPSEIRAAASFWRYMSQLAGVVGVVIALGLLDWNWLWRRLPIWVGRLGRGARLAPVAAALLVAALPGLAQAHLWPPAREPAPQLRRIAVALRPVVAGPAPVAVVDPRGNGMHHIVLRYAWAGQVETVWPAEHNAPITLEAAEMLRRLDAARARFVLLFSSDGEVEEAFDTPAMPPRTWRLLEREGAGWRLVASGRLGG